jgi:hypothetical protein
VPPPPPRLPEPPVEQACELPKPACGQFKMPEHPASSISASNVSKLAKTLANSRYRFFMNCLHLSFAVPTACCTRQEMIVKFRLLRFLVAGTNAQTNEPVKKLSPSGDSRRKVM